MFDTEDDNNFTLSNFDKLRIESMEIGDAVDGEGGDFRILRYKSGYLLFIFNEVLIRKYNISYKEFIDYSRLINFLES